MTGFDGFNLKTSIIYAIFVFMSSYNFMLSSVDNLGPGQTDWFSVYLCKNLNEDGPM